MAHWNDRNRILDLRNPHLADVIYENLMEEIIDFQNDLDENHEVAVLLTSFGASVVMSVTELGYQNPDLLYFYGYVNGNEARLIQHVNQLNFLLLSMEREDKTQPARRIGFRSSKDEEEAGKPAPEQEPGKPAPEQEPGKPAPKQEPGKPAPKQEHDE